MIAFIIVAFVVAPFGYQAIGAWRDRRRYPPPGRIIDGLHVFQTGMGATVILESGIAGTSLSWKPVQDRVSLFARVYSYDRAGLGWSAAARTPRTVDNLVAELRALQLPKPYILVGHSFGGLLVQHYAAHYPEDVRGLVLVDPVPISDWHPLTPLQKIRLARGVALSRRGALLARAGVVRLALDLLMSGLLVIPKLMARVTAGNGASVTSRLTSEVRKLPREVWPMVRAQWCLPRSFLGMADYLELLPENAANAKQARGVSTIVLTAPGSHCEIPQGADQRIAKKSGHWIQLDEPDLVADAIRDLLKI